MALSRYDKSPLELHNHIHIQLAPNYPHVVAHHHVLPRLSHCFHTHLHSHTHWDMLSQNLSTLSIIHTTIPNTKWSLSKTYKYLCSCWISWKEWFGHNFLTFCRGARNSACRVNWSLEACANDAAKHSLDPATRDHFTRFVASFHRCQPSHFPPLWQHSYLRSFLAWLFSYCLVWFNHNIFGLV